MKTKNRFLFILLLVAVGGFALYWNRPPARFVASDGLSEGQRDKYELIESLRLWSTAEEIVLETRFLGTLCASSTEIELVFAAEGIAIDGMSPTIQRVFTCSQLGENLSTGELRVSLAEFRASYFPGEVFPEKWFLKGIQVRGASPFGISEFELAQVRGANLELDL